MNLEEYHKEEDFSLCNMCGRRVVKISWRNASNHAHDLRHTAFVVKLCKRCLIEYLTAYKFLTIEDEVPIGR